MSGLFARCLLFFFLAALVSVAYSATNQSYFDLSPLPLLPRLSATGLAGTETLGLADVMVPLVGNHEGDFYTDIQGKVGNDRAWMGSVGVGYRQVVNDADILGGYVFVDRDQTKSQNHFWVLSPGLESLGERWDFRVNGYIPVSATKIFSNSATGEELGLGAQTVTFSGHQQFDHLFKFYEEIGAGADAEAGRIFPSLNRLAIYGGGYYFNLADTSAIKGGEARVEFPLTGHVTLLVSDSYDNHQHNTIEAGVRVSIGGTSSCPVASSSCDIHNRLLDPVNRNFGALDTGSGIPSANVRQAGPKFLARDNIWFFTQGSGSIFNPAVGEANCTINNPCGPNQLNQTNINAINTIAKNANFYLNSGSGNYSLNGQLTINNGQNTFGRSLDYTMPAIGNGRPVLTGGLVLQGNNRLDSIQLFNAAIVQPIGIQASNADNITLNNVHVGALNSQQGYLIALNLLQVDHARVNNSTLNAYAEGGVKALAQGIHLEQSSLALEKSQINVTAITNVGNAEAAGIFSNVLGSGSNNLHVTSSAITANATGTTRAEAIGIFANSGTGISNPVNISFSALAANAVTNNGEAEAAGIFANSNSVNSPVNVSFCNIKGNANSLNGGAESVAVAFSDISELNVIGSDLQSNAISHDVTESVGILAGGNGKTRVNVFFNTIATNAISTNDISRAAGLLAYGIKANVVGNKIFGDVRAKNLAEAFGVVVEHGSSTVFADHNVINLTARSEMNNATAFAFSAFDKGDTIIASNNLGILQAEAPYGTAIAQSANPFDLGSVIEINDRFIKFGFPIPVSFLRA